MTRTLIVPGLGDSGPTHWQTWFESRLHDTVRVIQPDWGLPDLGTWADRVATEIAACEAPPIIVAHSFGCLASARAAARPGRRVAAMMLVAPADPDVFGYAHLLPQSALAAPAILVASRSDPWMRFDRAAWWADRWGARLIDLGNVAHINVEAGFGPWPQGLGFYRELSRAAQSIRTRARA
jgi:predicted alpha/beta hydrolase family esterase